MTSGITSIAAELQEKRAVLKGHDREFKARMEDQYLRETHELKADIEYLVRKLAENNVPVSQIMKHYGTKDWRTVNDIIRSAPKETPKLIDGLVTILPDGDEEFLITVADYKKWTVDGNAGVEYSGRMRVRKTGGGLPIPITPVPDTERGKPLHSELIKGSKDSPLMQEWSNFAGE